MNKLTTTAILAATTLAIGMFTFLPLQNAATDDDDVELISESALLNGLAANALFPFIDTTPNKINRAHIAITDSTTDCTPGAADPANVQVLVGVAGGTLVDVMTASTNTGIGSITQCVFHVTINPGKAGVPSTVTDIVVASGSSALTGVNTITVSAEVRT